jgi:hypothetical protein
MTIQTHIAEKRSVAGAIAFGRIHERARRR